MWWCIFHLCGVPVATRAVCVEFRDLHDQEQNFTVRHNGGGRLPNISATALRVNTTTAAPPPPKLTKRLECLETFQYPRPDQLLASAASTLTDVSLFSVPGDDDVAITTFVTPKCLINLQLCSIVPSTLIAPLLRCETLMTLNMTDVPEPPVTSSSPFVLHNLEILEMSLLNWETPDSVLVAPRLKSLTADNVAFRTLPALSAEHTTFVCLIRLFNMSPETLAESVRVARNCEHLDLRGSNIRDATAICDNLQRLKILDLGFCNDLQALPESVATMRDLEYLNAEYCTSIDEGGVLDQGGRQMDLRGTRLEVIDVTGTNMCTPLVPKGCRKFNRW